MLVSDATRAVEEWLLIPIDYEKIIPALAVLKKTPEYGGYLEKVAKAEYKSTFDVDSDVENYILTELPNLELQQKKLEERLDAVADGERFEKPAVDDDEALVEALSGEPPEPSPEDQARMLREKAFKAYLQQSGVSSGAEIQKRPLLPYASYVSAPSCAGQETALVGRRCPDCNRKLQMIEVKSLSKTREIWMILLLIVCWPVGLFYMFFAKREVRQVWRCAYCQRVIR